jgi:dihydrofolate synthase / folylpolyglutamate synthase
MNYADTLAYLYDQLPMFHRVGPAAYKPGLDNILALSDIIGNPQQHLRFVHIAGTNGKGSTSHLIASVMQEAGFRTGLYTSPHLVDFRERIRVNGAMVGKEDVIHFVEKYKSAVGHLSPSFFEWTQALAMWYFEKEKCDIVVLETGLGGRLDSTNIVTPEVSVVTNIGMDHTHLLGDTIAAIATEKAGIIKSGIPVVIGETGHEAHAILLAKANERSALVYFSSEVKEPIPDTPLLGIYQQQNTRTALAALRCLQDAGWAIDEQHIHLGFERVVANTGLMGRWQVLSDKPLCVVDVAHNEDGVQMIVRQLETLSFEHLHVVLGMVNDKDIRKVMELLPKNATYYFCKANIPRGLDAVLLAEEAELAGLKGSVYSSVSAAYHAAKERASDNDMVFVGGSFFTVAEVLSDV